MVINIDKSEFDNTACIVYPVEWPSNRINPIIPELHSTILYLGDIDEDLDGMSAQAMLDILSPVDTNYFQYIDTEGWGLFGPDKNIPVVKLTLTERMTEIHRDVEDVFMSAGYESPSEFSYSPHVTVNVETYQMNNLPDWVLLRQPELWYREEKILFGSARRAYRAGRPNDNYK